MPWAAGNAVTLDQAIADVLGRSLVAVEASVNGGSIHREPRCFSGCECIRRLQARLYCCARNLTPRLPAGSRRTSRSADEIAAKHHRRSGASHSDSCASITDLFAALMR